MLAGVGPLYLFELLSHRVLRYASGLLHVVLLASSIALAGDGLVYQVALALQLLWLVLAALGRLRVRVPGAGIAYYYFLVTWATRRRARQLPALRRLAALGARGGRALRRTVALLAVLAAVCACASASGSARDERDLSAYTGLATWVDLYDPHVLKRPESSVAAMAAHGVRTLFFETSNYQMKQAIVRRDRVDRFIAAAHAEGLQIVAWYLPSLTDLQRDLRRSLAALNYETSTGEQFDSFALDIEATLVRSPSLRNARLLQLSRKLRAAEPDLALGAIVPSPRGIQLLPWYWPHFPYAELARIYDVFLPMGYFTYRKHYPGGSAAYTRTNIKLLREGTGNPLLPVHTIGGLAGYASPSQVRGFVRAARNGAAIGSSLYDFASTTSRQWPELLPANDLPTTG